MDQHKFRTESRQYPRQTSNITIGISCCTRFILKRPTKQSWCQPEQYFQLCGYMKKMRPVRLYVSTMCVFYFLRWFLEITVERTVYLLEKMVPKIGLIDILVCRMHILPNSRLERNIKGKIKDALRQKCQTLRTKNNSPQIGCLKRWIWQFCHWW